MNYSILGSCYKNSQLKYINLNVCITSHLIYNIQNLLAQEAIVCSLKCIVSKTVYFVPFWWWSYPVEVLTGGNVQMHDKLARSQLHRSSIDLGRSSSTIITPPLHPRNYRPHAPRASTWCCGSFVLRQLRKTQHLEQLLFSSLVVCFNYLFLRVHYIIYLQ